MPYATIVVRLVRRKLLTRSNSPCDSQIAHLTLPRPPHPAPTSVTIAIRPSFGTGQCGRKSLIWGNRQASAGGERSMPVRPNSTLTKRWCSRPLAASNSSPTGNERDQETCSKVSDRSPYEPTGRREALPDDSSAKCGGPPEIGIPPTWARVAEADQTTLDTAGLRRDQLSRRLDNLRGITILYPGNTSGELQWRPR